ncbi:MAG: hypothetical protein K0S71_1437 [Clostridia bacterium]|jgi:hypothetical protein|nr:hypothetical protein [Clostridia bacterium]
MTGRKKHSQKGMTYAEVAVCLFVIAIIITPLSVSLVSSTKIRTESEAISISTLNAEALMEDIKVQLTKDIALKNRREGNILKDTDPADVVELNKRTEYLINPPDETTLIDIKDFLALSSAENRDSHDTKYDTSKYEYEIAIWNMNEISLSMPSKLSLNKDTLKDAIKLYSNMDPSMRFDSSLETEDLVDLTIAPEMAKSFKGTLLKDSFIPSGFEDPSAGYVISDVKTISFKKRDANSIEDTSILPNNPSEEILHIDQEAINAGADGYVYTISETRPVGEIEPNSRGVVLLDLRQLVRDFNPSLTFKFINKINVENYTLVIKVLRNVKKNDTTPSLETLEEIDKKFNIVAVDKGQSKTIIERIIDSDLDHNYLIVMIVRDKSPRVGKPGKVVKKMVEVYNYAPKK